MYICIYVYVYICIYVYMYICIHVYMYICIQVYKHVYMYICNIHVYTIFLYMYTCTYVYMHIYTYSDSTCRVPCQSSKGQSSKYLPEVQNIYPKFKIFTRSSKYLHVFRQHLQNGMLKLKRQERPPYMCMPVRVCMCMYT